MKANSMVRRVHSIHPCHAREADQSLWSERRSLFRAGRSWLGAMALVVACGPVLAQGYPNRPIRVIVPNTPGTVYDHEARVLAPEMSKILGQPLVVENRGGAGGVIGTEYVAKQAPADGYTILPAGVEYVGSFPTLQKDLRFDPGKDILPVLNYAELRLVLLTSSKSPLKTMADLVNASKTASLNYGSSAASFRILTEMLIREFGMKDVVFVRYPSGAPLMQGLAVGDVHFGFLGEATSMAIADRTRALATMGKQRSAVFPDAPTFGELGHPNFPTGVTDALFVRTGTDRAIIAKLHDAVMKSLELPAVKERFAKLNLIILGDAHEVAVKSYVEKVRLFTKIAEEAGVKPE